MSLPTSEDVLAIRHQFSAVHARGRKSFKRALELKEEGNKHFGKKETTRALACYSEVHMYMHVAN